MCVRSDCSQIIGLRNQGRRGQASILYLAAVVWISDIIHHAALCKIPPYVLSLRDQDTQYGKPARNQLVSFLLLFWINENFHLGCTIQMLRYVVC